MTGMVRFDSRLSAVLEAFEEALAHRELNYSISTLKRYGFSNQVEVDFALKRAMGICNELGINPKRHFTYFYKVDMSGRQVMREWKASKLGFYLVLCNGVPNNPFTGALQIEMLTEILHKLE